MTTTASTVTKPAVTAATAPQTKQSRLVVCITGMPGAGKSTASEISPSMGFEVFRMGDDVRMEAERRKLAPTDENLGVVMLQLRQSGGPAAIAQLCKVRIEREAKTSFVLIDGVRNVNEFLEFKKLGKALLVAIHASPERRYKFLQARGRSDSPNSYQSFESRDRRELSVGIGESIALADEMVVNKGSVEDLRKDVAALLDDLKHQFTSEQK